MYAVPECPRPGRHPAQGERARARDAISKAHRAGRSFRRGGGAGMQATGSATVLAAAWSAASRGLARRAVGPDRASDTRPDDPVSGGDRATECRAPSGTAGRRQVRWRLVRRAVPCGTGHGSCPSGAPRPARRARAPRVPSPGGRRRRHGQARSRCARSAPGGRLRVTQIEPGPGRG